LGKRLGKGLTPHPTHKGGIPGDEKESKGWLGNGSGQNKRGISYKRDITAENCLSNCSETKGGGGGVSKWGGKKSRTYNPT